MSYSFVASRLNADAFGKSPGIPGFSGLVTALVFGCLLENLAAQEPKISGTAVHSGTVTTSEEVVVTGVAPQGSEAAGYRVCTVSAGPLGEVPIQDTPFSVSVVPSALIDNLQASTPSQALRYEPTVQPALGSNLAGDYFMIRGFVSSLNSNSTAIDGMRTYAISVPIEDKERIEVMAGANSFLYGITSPGGMINYILKRPTSEPLANVTVGDYSGSEFYTHGDFGGPLDKNGKVMFRLNLMYADGAGMSIPDQTHERSLFSGAVDWHITEDTTISLEGSHSQRDVQDAQAIFLIGPARKVNGVSYLGVTSIPDAPDPDKNYGAPYGYTKDSYNQGGIGFTSKLSDVFTIRSNFRYNVLDNESYNLRHLFLDNDGHYIEQMYVKGLHQTQTTQGNLFLDAVFETGAIRHKVSLGYMQDHVVNLNPYPNQNKTYTSSGYLGSLEDPTYGSLASFGVIDISSGRPYRTSDITDYRTVVLADQIDFTEKLGLLAGFTIANIDNDNWDIATGNSLPGVNQTAVTPGAALTYKFTPNLTAYASYFESLQNAGTVPSGYGYANQYAALNPYLAHQEEIGVKTTIKDVFLTAALFRIDKACYTVTPDNYYTDGGTEVHQGIEFTATGKVLDNLRVVGGFTLLDATIEDQKINKAGTSLDGKTPDGVPNQIAKLYTEYDLPWVPGLTLTGGISYVGREYVDASANKNMDTMTIPAVVLGDVGMRYRTRLKGHDLTLRFTVQNVTNEAYWTSKGDTMLYLGEPRTFAFSAELAWF